MLRAMKTGGFAAVCGLCLIAAVWPPHRIGAEDGWRKTSLGWEQSGGWRAGPLSPSTEPVAVPLGPGAVHPLSLAFAQLFCIAAAFTYLSRRRLVLGRAEQTL